MIAFVHIPKTAGSTLRTIFANSLAKPAIFNSGNSFGDPDGPAERIAGLMRTDVAAPIEIVLGHTSYGLLRAYLPPQTRYVTLLREPVDRLLSNYYFMMLRRRSADHRVVPTREGARDLPMPPTITLEEMLRDGLYLPDNPATRLLCNRPTPYGELTMEHLTEAKENLSHFVCVGLTERLEESVALVERVLDRGVVPFVSTNVNQLRPTVEETSPELLDRIRDYNALDIELYQHGARLFDAQVAAAGDELAAEVEAIRAVSIHRDRSEAGVALGAKSGSASQGAP